MNVVFVPGTMCDERLWSQLMTYLDPRVRSRFVSLSEVVNRQSAKEVLSKEIADGAHVIAFSMGGYLALEYALAHPDRLGSLVIVAASARGLGPEERVRRQHMLERLSTRPYAGISKAQLAAYLSPTSMQDSHIVETIIEMDRTLGGRVLQSQMTATLERADLVESLHSIRCPVLVVGSVDDKLVIVEDLQEMHSRLQCSRLRLLTGSGHMIPLERPQELAAETKAFYVALQLL
jgi:pimeloyl-ACP methyl ester carboxylesterase